MIFLYEFFSKDNSSPLADRYSWIVLAVPVGIIYSFPLLIVYYLLFYFLSRRQIDAVRIKLILCSVCIVGILITFYLINGSMEFKDTMVFKGTMAFLLSMIYSGAVILCGFLFNVYRKTLTVAE